LTLLEDLLQQCTVKITVPGGGWGTGFFVSTGLILTCAHVVRKAADSQVTISCPAWQQPRSAIVKATADDGKTLDLALVELSEALPDHPCVLLDEEPVATGQALYSYGYLESYANAAPVRPVNEGLTGDTPPLLKLQGAQIEKGISGAALLNLKTGTVCGMVKETRAAGFDLGGGAIPTRVILEQFPELRSLQQSFHGGDKRWVNLITQPGIDFQPYLRSLIANEKYQQKWGFYTPTDATSKIQQPRAASELDIGLMVQLMQPKTAEGDGTSKQEEKTERLPVLEGIRKYAADHVLLMGRPGSGKSTALLSLLVEAAQQALADPSARIPVLVELRYLEADRPSVLERIGAFLQSHALSVEEATLKALLAEGKLLLLIDGVNELPSESARRAIARFRQDYAKTPMIFTTRDMAIGGDVGIEKKLEMQPLNESQMRQFVQAYLPEQGEPMLRQLQGRLREVGQTPLLLWMLCQVFQGLHQIPTSLGLLFRWFAGEYDKLKRDVPVSEGLRHWQAELLQQLAFTMMQAAEPTELQVAIPRPEVETILAAFLQGKVDYPAQRAKEWLEDLLEHHLIQPTSQNQLEFHHQLLQEYYAAEYLLKLLPTLTDEQLKQDYLNYLKWTEPLALMLALVDGEAQAVRVVQQALAVDLMLGARLAGEVKPEFQVQTVKFVEDLEVPDWLKVKLLEMGRSEFSITALLNALTDSNGNVRRHAANALGKLGSEGVIPALLNAIEHSNADVRGNAAYALGQLGSEAAIPALLNAIKDSDYLVRHRAAYALRQLGSEAAIPGLLNALTDSNGNVRRHAANTLGDLGSEAAIPGLLNAIEHSNADVRGDAAHALGKLGSEAAIPILLNALKDSNASVRGSAAYALGQLGSEAAIPALLSTLKDSDVYVRCRAAEALGRLGSEVAIPILLNEISSPYSRASEVLGQLGSEAAIPGLLNALKDSNGNVRKNAAKALGELGSEAAIPGLLNALKDSNDNVRESAAKALGELGSEAAIPGLLNALKDSNAYVRKSLVYALGQLRSEAAIPGLLNALKDSSADVRWCAAYALEKLHSEAVIPALLKVIKHSYASVRWSAAYALGQLGSEAAIPALLKMIKHSNYSVRSAAIQALRTTAKNHPESVSPHLPRFLTLIPEASGEEARYVILAIQENCKYYNYEIFQAHLAAQKTDCQTQPNRDPNAITIQTLERLTIMTDKAPIFNQQHATIGVNYAAEGSKVEFTQHTISSEQTFEILLTDYQQFIQQLQQKYPTLADPTTVPQLIEVEAKLIEAQEHHRWQNFLNLKRLWNGGKKAGVKVGEHFAENNVWAKGAIAFLEGVSEDGK
jgi:HEAT repeat protein